MTRLGDRAKHPTANSSTTKGRKLLAGKSFRRRSRTGKIRALMGKGALLPSAPRNHRLKEHVETMPGREPGTYDAGPRGNTRLPT
jgi:hypothetical protein